jgi:hypothetical protein
MPISTPNSPGGVFPLYPDGTTNKDGIAGYLGISPRTVDYWVATRKIPFQRRSARMLRFVPEEVKEALAKLTVRTLAR